MIRPVDSTRPIVHAYHRAWSAAVGRPRYDKGVWKRLEQEAHDVEVAVTARARAAGALVEVQEDVYGAKKELVASVVTCLADLDARRFLDELERLLKEQGAFSSEEWADLAAKGTSSGPATISNGIDQVRGRAAGQLARLGRPDLDEVHPVARDVVALLAVVEALPKCSRCGALATRGDVDPHEVDYCDLHAPGASVNLDYAVALRALSRPAQDPGGAALRLDGAQRILAERVRQVTTRGFSPAHDDEHTGGDLALAAACYAAAAADVRIYERGDFADGQSYTDPFPWSKGGRGAACEDARPYNGNVLKTPTDEQAIRLLEKAGALIAAEIDRLVRCRPQVDDRELPRYIASPYDQRCRKRRGADGPRCLRIWDHGTHGLDCVFDPLRERLPRERPASDISLCGHANECPHVCPCGPGCYCKGRTCAGSESDARRGGR